ncbi:transposase [Streptomyces sp. NBC_01257]|uniref:transposase n=1 Tax=Streptomyces sp. NBC_01257 TaxID=2903799 RepID=UPI003FA3AA73
MDKATAETLSKATRGYDAGKKINGRRRYIAVDTLGLPVMITVTRADISYRDAARELLWRLRLTQPQITQVWADSAYAGQLVNRADDRLWMTLRTISRPRGAKGCVVLPRHWKVERTIGWVMNARRNVHDYERLPHHSEAHMKPGTHCAHDEAAHPEKGQLSTGRERPGQPAETRAAPITSAAVLRRAPRRQAHTPRSPRWAVAAGSPPPRRSTSQRAAGRE